MTAPLTYDDEHLWLMLKALGNPVRLQIVRFVQRHPHCIGNEILLHLPDECARAQSTLSQHLRILRDAALLEAECEGHMTSYTVNRQQLDWLRQQLGQL